MDTYEIVEANRFVGREFLLWLWFETEVFETNIGTSSGERCALWVDGRLMLAGEGAAGRDVRVIGANPGASREAREALRQGKLPYEAHFRAVMPGATEDDTREFSWTLIADRMAIVRLRVPGLLTAKEDDHADVLSDRMDLLGKVETLVEGLYRDFLVLRTGSTWSTHFLPALRAFVHDKPIDVDAYQEVKAGRLAKRAAAAGKI